MPRALRRPPAEDCAAVLISWASDFSHTRAVRSEEEQREYEERRRAQRREWARRQHETAVGAAPSPT